MKFLNNKIDVLNILMCLFFYNLVWFLFNGFNKISFIVCSQISGFALMLIFSAFFYEKCTKKN